MAPLHSHALPAASFTPPPRNASGRRPLSFAPPREALAEPAPRLRRPRAPRGERALLLVLVTAAHVAALATLAHLAQRPAAPPETPISVALIELPVPLPTVAPTPPAPPKPVVEPPKPRPQVRAPKPVPKTTESPTAIRTETPPPQAMPEPVREAAPTPPAPPAPAARPAPEAPPAVVAARFDAAYLNNPAPAYPPLSRRMREEGKVMLRVQVTAEGLPAQVDLAESSGFARLDSAAREAVQRWRFVPAKQGGQAVAAAVIVPIVFKLEGN